MMSSHYVPILFDYIILIHASCLLSSIWLHHQFLPSIVSAKMVQRPSDQAMQLSPTPAANSGLMNDTMASISEVASVSAWPMPITVASASMAAPNAAPKAVVKARAPHPPGGVRRVVFSQGSSESMVAHNGSVSNEQVRLNDVTDVDSGIAEAAAAVADAAEEPPPPPPPADDYVPNRKFCSMCHLGLHNQTNQSGQMYRMLPNSHAALSTRQIIYLMQHPTLIRHHVPVCYCCTTDMFIKAYVDLLASQRDTPGAIEINDALYGIDRSAPP